VMSFVVGVMLLIFCVMIILRHGFGVAAKAEMIVAQIHGLLYMVYLVTVALVMRAYRLPFSRIVLMAVSGFIPFLAFFMEKKVVNELKAATPRH